jgi:hypothetical protein
VAALDPAKALNEADFRLTGPSGFGDGWNHYAHSMAWFEGRLYVGATRAQMAFMKRVTPKPDLQPWPVQCPDDLVTIERRAEIYRYTPESGEWVSVFRSPMVKGIDGKPIASFVGYRGMSVFQGLSDSKPCLYVSCWSPQKAGPAKLLRSEDGENFHEVSAPPWGPYVRAFRTLQEFQGRVHTTPTASGMGFAKVQDSVGSNPTIFGTDDPRTGGWQAVSERGFGNPNNLTIFEMEAFDGHLYAATVNAAQGLELWKTPGGDMPYRWTRVLERGAWRGNFNEVGGSMCEFQGALYIGSGVLNGGYHRALKVGPAATELLRVWPDGSWDLIMGESRVTPQGVKYPLSGYAPGFDNLFNGYVWRMCVHQGHLYAGTFCWANLLPYLAVNGLPEHILAMLRRWGKEELIRRFGGCELWRSADGVNWTPVTRSGFGNPYNWGIRTMASTPWGLFVATANPYGPMVAVQRGGKWQYVPNPRGGCEVYLGSKAHSAALGKAA